MSIALGIQTCGLVNDADVHLAINGRTVRSKRLSNLMQPNIRSSHGNLLEREN